MEDFSYRYRNISILVVVLVAQFVLLGYQVRRNDNVRFLRVWAVAIIMPIQKVLDGSTGFFQSAWKDYVWLRDARRENERLREELDQLKLERQQLRRVISRFDREEEFLAYQKEIPSQTILASVIAAGANPNAREIYVNKGTSDGVKPGMAVITPDGAVGKIQAAFGQASLVLLLNDADNAVGVMLTDSREHGVMKGTGKRECRVDYVGNEVKVPVGAHLYTSGDDRIYPKGLPVGTVTRVEPGPEFLRIYATPFAELNRLEEVLIVTQGVHQDLPTSLQPQPPASLMPMPPASPDPLISSTPAPEVAESGEEPAGEPPAAVSEPALSEPLTDADRIEQRYRALGEAQGHTFGEGTPGTKPPDFNMGLTPPEPAPEPNVTPRETNPPSGGAESPNPLSQRQSQTGQPSRNTGSSAAPEPIAGGRAVSPGSAPAPATGR